MNIIEKKRDLEIRLQERFLDESEPDDEVALWLSALDVITVRLRHWACEARDEDRPTADIEAAIKSVEATFEEIEKLLSEDAT